MRWIGCMLCGGWLLAGWASLAAAAQPAYRVGVAKVDITPDYPVRLSGFGFRRAESEGVRQKVWAKALAIGQDDQPPLLVITVDNLGIPDSMTGEVSERLRQRAGLSRERLAITATHTHTAPMLTPVAPTLFSMPIPAEHQQRIDRYTRELTDRLTDVALAALGDRQPAELAWGIGKVGFAVNRRTRGGPVDHELPVLAVRDGAGKLRAIWTSYACHCVTLSDNRVSGDWAGFAQEALERAHPGAVALVSVGCGADSNPNSGVTGDRGEAAASQGNEIASEVARLLDGKLESLSGRPAAQRTQITLPLDKPRTLQEWQARAKQGGAVGYHAQVNLARLERGEKLPTQIDYPVQSFRFGDQLALVFLPGEVVVDYSLRLKRELDGGRLWINAYANAAPCYIPSERILNEGGYEGGDAMVYYDLPQRIAPGAEKRIVDAVRAQLDADFGPKVNTQRTQGSRPLTPRQSIAAMQTAPGMTVELVAAEPLVADPVAIDFGPDGRLWVAEMHDYPAGIKGDYAPGGRVKVLVDDDGDGRYDRGSVFLDGIPFPTGLTVWRQGLLVCTAPDVLYAEDTDGDGRADVVRTLLTGFGKDNFQGRVNSLAVGLDGWVYGSCGLFGGRIKSSARPEPVSLGDRDFRFRPDSGELEPVSGQTQQGRARNDAGDWFGCDSGTLARHYPVVDHYVRRNPHVAPPPVAVFVPNDADPGRLLPISQPVLFALSGPPGRPTAACGLGIYRDELLGAESRGDAFTCEPVNNLVHRLRLSPDGVTFRGRRPPDETEREFLASRDLWFRPVQARTGPDGALWVVDMYRYVIEHPRWIPPDVLATLDTRAGDAMGRIYRVYRRDRPPRRPARLDRLDAAGLVAALESPNGVERDLAMQMLWWRRDPSAAGPLAALARGARRAETRCQALCTLAVLAGASDALLDAALADPAAIVRRHAVRLREARGFAPQQLEALLTGADPQVRLQLAYSLGQSQGHGAALARLLLASADDPYLVAAVLSSATGNDSGELAGEVVRRLAQRASGPPAPQVIAQVVVNALRWEQGQTAEALRTLTTDAPQWDQRWRLDFLAGVLPRLAGQRKALQQLTADPQLAAQIEKLLAAARGELGGDGGKGLRAVQLLGYWPPSRDADLAALDNLLAPQTPVPLQLAAIAALLRLDEARAGGALLSRWQSYTPQIRGEVLDLLLRRESSTRMLLAALETGRLAARDFDAARRERLLTLDDPALRRQAAKLLAAQPDGDRAAVVERHQDVLRLSADAARGEKAFAGRCAACHVLRGVGHAVGPDLAALPDKSPAKLLASILDPSRQVDARYIGYIAATEDGQVWTGLLAAESGSSITLRAADGKEQVILRRELAELRSSNKSLMPDGLENDLSRQDLADVMAYVASIGPPPRSFPGNRPELVRGAADGSLVLRAASAEIFGDQIAFETQFGNLGMWHGQNDHAAWTVELASPADLDVYLDFACHDASAGNRLALAAFGAELRSEVPGTGGWDRYRLQKLGTLHAPQGRGRLTVRPDGPLSRTALIDLRGVLLVPRGQKPPAQAPSAASTANDDPAELARRLLDAARPEAEREAIVASHPKLARELIAALVADLPEDREEEYRRIPWIWRVAIAAGKRNDAAELRELLDRSLPPPEGALRHWQAVVIGGGLVNGVSQRGVWPLRRFAEVLERDAGLERRWRRAIELAATMADDQAVPTGTRYDALRMLGADTWERRGNQLAKYLAADAHAELQMGAVGGVSDVDSAEAARALAAGLSGYAAENRSLALDGLLRSAERAALLLKAVEQKHVGAADLGPERVKALREHADPAVRARAQKALP